MVKWTVFISVEDSKIVLRKMYMDRFHSFGEFLVELVFQ